ncbi:sulfurtransferase [Methylibium sp.]|uniref:sulfurtransferase n=1 Tax=Methylibium sp. TaxID=2067992 RepID=UPI003D14032B
MSAAASILNLAAYKFVTLEDPALLRARLMEEAQAAALKGSILLAEEGINFFLAGDAAAARAFLSMLRRDRRFADLHAKESWSRTQPFRRLRVKLKREIIRMDHPTIRPAAARAPALDSTTLARWLDAGRCEAGRPLLMLDTRNGFEVDAGRFVGALDWRLERFGDFPAALAAHRATLEGKTVVSYCTGGIRCEKAALLMREQGLEHVLQLDGGILQYFETVGGHHYEGGCFVFDERGTLDARLQPSPA